MSKPRALVLLALFLVALAAALFLAPGRGYWVVDPDAAAYVGLARSLAAGDGYSFAGVPHVKFPPGFPAYLSLAIRATGDPECYGAMRDLVTVAGLVSVLLTFLVGLRLLRLSAARAMILAVAAGTSIFLFQYSVAFLRSETTFTALFLAALLAGESWRGGGGAGRAALAGILAGAAALVRTAGVTAIVAIVAARFLHRQRLRAPMSRGSLVEGLVFLILALLPPGAFAVRNAAVETPAASGYMDELLQSYALDRTKDIDLDMPAIDAEGWQLRLAQNVTAVALSLGKFLLNDNTGANLAVQPDSGALLPGGVLLLAVLVLGWLFCWRRGLLLVALVLPLYIALYLTWPFNQQQRFYLPVQPLLLCLLAFGAAPFLKLGLALASRSSGRWLLVALAAILTLGLARRESALPEVFGRYSTKYALILAAAATVTLGLLALALWMGRRPFDPAVRFRWCVRGAFTVFLVLSFAQAARSLADMKEEQERFLAQRVAEPVDPAYAKLKGRPELFALFDVLRQRSEPGDLVMSDIPKMIHVCTGLRTVPFIFSSQDRTIQLEPSGERVRFLYFSREIPQVAEVFDEVLARDPDRFEVLHEIEVEGGPAELRVLLLRVVH